MSALRLRRIDPVALALRQAVAAWRRRGVEFTYHAPREGPRPTDGAMLLAVGDSAAAHGWRGWIDAGEWLAHVAPALAALAPQAAGGDAIARLFAATPGPLTLPASLAGDGVRLFSPACESSLSGAPMAVLDLPQGRLWLRHLPLPEHASDATATAAAAASASSSTAGHAAGGHVPVQLQWMLGDSHLSRGCLARVGTGDVLLMTRQALRLRCRDWLLGSYLINDEGVMVDDLLDEAMHEPLDKMPDETTRTRTRTRTRTPTGASADGPRGAPPMARIPVRLEFMLQQTTLSIAELGALTPGDVMKLDPLAEKQVRILANGVALGWGELVQMEQHLGVEILGMHGMQDGGGDDAD